jgi:hypothetical protein
VSDHCHKCGRHMVFRAKPTGKFDSFTGAPTQNEYRVCPEWKPRFIGDNGHDWRHRGTNPINGVMPHGPDPFIHENASSPRGAV